MTHPAALEKLLSVRSWTPRRAQRHGSNCGISTTWSAPTPPRRGTPARCGTGPSPTGPDTQVLVPLLQDLLSGLRHRLDQVHGQDTGATELLNGPAPGLPHARFPQTVLDPAELMQDVDGQYQQEKTLWDAQPADGPLFAVGRADNTHARRDLMRLDLHTDSRPARALTVPDLAALAAGSGMPPDTVRAWQAVWLRHRLTEDAPALSRHNLPREHRHAPHPAA
ncbi:hypothetical protein [Streptomyces sp. NPDC002133]|uniref:hypothetical protein n=1 Tax=Streptomyces sp. NPDC002133 TaxID=3154409 RepID=UPI00332BA1F0